VASGGGGVLEAAVVVLGAAVVCVPIARRLGLGAVLGYLIAGVIIGPWGVGFIREPKAILEISEFGVVLLLFLIGLELEPKRLWAMRANIFGLGTAQVVLTAVALGAVAAAAGWTWQSALVAGLAFSLSSTAIALKPLTERGLLNTRGGNATFAVLLFQDIAVIPILALIAFLAPATAADAGGSRALEALKVVGVIVGIIVAGRFVLPFIFRYIARTGLREVFTAFSLFLVVGVSALMQAVGLSMALGAFISGVLLAESEYRHELEADIEPFKALLLGLFFMSVGMSVDFGLAMAKPWVTLFAVAALILGKLAILWGLARWATLPGNQRGLFALLLAGGGEFAFVVAQLAEQRGVMPSENARLIVIVVALSMLIAPLLFAIYDRIESRRDTAAQKPPPDAINDDNVPAIIAGFGRVGQVVSRVLNANGFATTVLDYEPDRVETARQFGFKVYYGDATRADLLEMAGVDKARLLVIAVDDKDSATRLAALMRERYPHVAVVSRAWDMVHAWSLYDAGVFNVHKESFAGALSMASDSLRQLGVGAYQAERAVHRFARHDHDVMQELYKVSQGELSERIAVSKRLREQIEKVFATDRAKLKKWDNKTSEK
jgi:glutathione-regulated potassium-efflux system ancillary protein KefC